MSFIFMCLLFQIDNEEYGEALSLAQTYGLDSDLVYQRQWRKSAVNVASIQDYLVRLCSVIFFFFGFLIRLNVLY